MNTRPQPDPLAVTQVEAAKLLKVSDRTLRNWERQGIIRSVRIGGVRRYSYRALKLLVKA